MLGSFVSIEESHDIEVGPHHDSHKETSTQYIKRLSGGSGTCL